MCLIGRDFHFLSVNLGTYSFIDFFDYEIFKLHLDLHF